MRIGVQSGITRDQTWLPPHPTIVFPDGTVLVEPFNAQLAEKLGMQTQAKRAFYDAIIIGGGPTGLTAATYLAREGVNVLVIEKAGLGGQVGTTQTLDNFPGFDEGIPGAEFAARLTRQAQRFGAEILQAQNVISIKQDGQYLCVHTSEVEFGITSLSRKEASPVHLLNIRRTHWGIETGLHYRRDVTLHEDATRMTTGIMGNVMASLNNLVLALIRQAKFHNAAQARRWFAAHLSKAFALLTTPFSRS